MTTDQTRSTARRYFEAWSTQQGPDVLREVMAEGFTFQAGDMVIEGREAFLETGAWPAQAETTLVAEAYDGSSGIQIYEATNHGVSVKIADHLTVIDGRVVSADTICDGAAFQAFMSAG